MAFGNELKFNNAYIWANDIETKNGTFRKYKLSVSGKDKDGNAMYADLDVQLPKNCPEIHNKTKVSTEGFLAADNYKNKDGKEIKKMKYVVMNIVLDDEDGMDSFEQVEESLPF